MHPAAREIAWGLLGMGLTALAFTGAAWSYPQGYDTIWAVGGATIAAVAILGGRDVMKAGGGDAAPETQERSDNG